MELSETVLRALAACPPNWTEEEPCLQVQVRYRAMLATGGPDGCEVLFVETETIHDKAWVHSGVLRGVRAQAVLLKFWTDMLDAAGTYISVDGEGTFWVRCSHADFPDLAWKQFNTRLEATAAAAVALTARNKLPK